MYLVIYKSRCDEDGEEWMTKAELEKRLVDSHWGTVAILRNLEDLHKTWGQLDKQLGQDVNGAILIFKGEIVVPEAVDVVREYRVP